MDKDNKSSTLEMSSYISCFETISIFFNANDVVVVQNGTRFVADCLSIVGPDAYIEKLNVQSAR